MNQYRRWCKWTLSIIFVILIFVIGTVIAVDPFFHYHKPIKNITYTLSHQLYQNPGIVRHFDYNSLITGSSMTENFQTSYFHEILGVDAIKVPYAGGTSKDMNIILDTALKSNSSLKNIYLGLDLNMLKADPNKTRNPLPTYLYDSNPLNDVNYLLNKDVLFTQVMKNIVKTAKKMESTSFDTYGFWDNLFTFSQYTTLRQYLDSENKSERSLRNDGLISTARENLEQNIIPLIKAYPDTEFTIFYPPYSIMYWHINNAEDELELLEYSVEALLPYDNVRLFLFINNTDIITNMYNYKDYSHYSADINKYMVDCFANRTDMVTADNYQAELEKMKFLTSDFDLGLLVGEKNPFIREEDVLKYIDKLDDKRYIAFFAMRSGEAFALDSQLKNQLGNLGLNEIGKDDSGGYLAISNGGEAFLEQTGNESLTWTGDIAQLSVKLVSEKRDNINNYIEITIDNLIYTTNQEGLNIVVYDKEHKRVMDNIAVNIATNTLARK